MKKPQKYVQGIISISSRGTGYVDVPEFEEDPEIDGRHLNTALHGDMVEVLLHPKGKGRQTGEVSKIISRAKMRFTGVLYEENNLYFLKPDDTRMYMDIMVAKESLGKAMIGDKVYVEITSFENKHKNPVGKVIKVLGRPGDNSAEMHAIAIDKGFDSELPDKVEEEAKKISAAGIQSSDYEGRKDFRKTLTFTIDPADAKDFDDAISFKVLPLNSLSPTPLHSHLNGEGRRGEEKKEELYEVGVHIADVSYYVRPGTALDEEARTRGTSVYLVDRTIAMLPEVLSNDLCSLVPHKDRLTMSAVFVVDKNAKVKSQWFGRSVINSQKRFTYQEAEESIKNKNGELHNELTILNGMAKKLTKERFDHGAISLDQEEVKFVLDKNGVPTEVLLKERGDSNKLIEEFMLLANKRVAELISDSKDKERVSIYRVHDLPSKEKMADLAYFLKSLGHKITLTDGLIPPHEINKLIKSLSGSGSNETVRNTVERAVVRSMAKAVYSTKNIGHYGLAFKYYTHFTSPIRRYPDIIVHRLLTEFLAGKKVNKENLKEYEKLALVSSEQEKRAADAERASIKYKQVEYMGKRIGESFNGVISGITEWGMYVEEEETKCEGMIRMRDMEDDFYIFNDKKLELVGQRKKKRYRLGDRVKIKVKGVDLERKTIDYVLV